MAKKQNKITKDELNRFKILGFYTTSKEIFFKQQTTGRS